VPAAKDRPISLDLAPGKEGDLLHMHALLMRGLADGEITPDEAAKVARVLAVGAKLLEVQRRLRKEEAVSGESKSPLPNPPPRAGEGVEAPVASLYFAASTASGAARPVSPTALRSSTALGAAPVSGLYFSRAA
jgi:hypothetical protein